MCGKNIRLTGSGTQPFTTWDIDSSSTAETVTFKMLSTFEDSTTHLSPLITLNIVAPVYTDNLSTSKSIYRNNPVIGVYTFINPTSNTGATVQTNEVVDSTRLTGNGA